MADDVVNRSTWQWTAKKEQAALLLANGATWAEVQQELSTSPSTLAAWKKAPEFQARIDEHLDAIIGEARDILRRGATKAARQIVALLESGTQYDSVKIGAAKDVLDRVGLKPVQKSEVSGPNGGPVPVREVVVRMPDEPAHD